MVKLILGDCSEKLKDISDESVDCVVTSPPYWALRDYGVAGQLGLETTFEEYIAKLCYIFDEIKRVLKPEGTCWVNIGDTYSGTGHKKDAKDPKYADGRNGQSVALNNKTSVQNKCLCCIPDRFKIEMVSRGWICRNEIIWFKPNCIPSSAKDRFTVDFEKVFFFVKSKKYFFKTQYEPTVVDYDNRVKKSANKSKYFERKWRKNTLSQKPFSYFTEKRNKRCVWRVATRPFMGAHFATYPEELISPMIDAGCPVGGTILDVFFGAGTTGLVALKQNKNCIGIELNADYLEIAKARIDGWRER